MRGRPSIGLFHDDGGEFIGGHAMNSDNKLKTASGLSKLWDEGVFDRVRAGDGASKHYGKRLAMHLMIQPLCFQPQNENFVAFHVMERIRSSPQ
jgi:hypothetical protein